MEREELIARKQAVRREIERYQRALAQAQAATPPAPRRIRDLEAQLERLMAEEYTLRLAIDRQGRAAR
jgi:chromosome segregation ATPase